jgi:hypothetical protein
MILRVGGAKPGEADQQDAVEYSREPAHAQPSNSSV